MLPVSLSILTDRTPHWCWCSREGLLPLRKNSLHVSLLVVKGPLKGGPPRGDPRWGLLMELPCDMVVAFISLGFSFHMYPCLCSPSAFLHSILRSASCQFLFYLFFHLPFFLFSFHWLLVLHSVFDFLFICFLCLILLFLRIVLYLYYSS